ncbi:MAG: N-acetylmuramoyl-L-alanine amidase [Phycisphaerales bacterium]|nr:N-acetylmuramoyl-L-alanine amidase [Phycisphaerales bacterium]
MPSSRAKLVNRQRNSTDPSTSGSPVTRTQAVWAVLVMAMTAVGGALWLLDRSGSTPRLDGLALASVVNSDQPPSIDQIFRTRQPIERSRWKAIVIQHSGTSSGTPETLAAKPATSQFHFLVGNGRGMDEGGLYVDHRWLLQQATGSASGSDGRWYNQNAIWISLVGDGEQGEFSPAQIDRLVDLVGTLAQRLGIPAENVRLESDIARDRSPGRFFPGAVFHERLASAMH